MVGKTPSILDYEAAVSLATKAWLLGYAEACTDNAARLAMIVR
jgi:hypothetical protein